MLRIALLTSLFPVSLLANEPSIFDLDLSELTLVEIASKTTENQLTVPSSTTVFDTNALSSLGINNVYDVLNYVPGMQITRGDWVGSVPKEHARGVYLDNGYLLIMIDGVRINDISFGKASVYSPHIPISAIERVEVIRGPGSVIYGSNAFLGAVNFITKKTSNNVELGIGNNGLKSLLAQYEANLTIGRLSSVFSATDHNGSSYVSRFNRKVYDPLSNYFLSIDLDYEHGNVHAFINHNTLHDFINLGGFSQENAHQSQTSALEFNHTILSTDKFEVDLKASYANFQIDSSGMVIAKEQGITQNDFLTGPYWRTQSTDLSLSAVWQYTSSISLNFGGALRYANQYQAGIATTHYDTVNQRVIPNDAFYLGETINFKSIPEFNALRENQRSNAIFGEIRWQKNNDFTLFAGARYDSIHQIDSKLSPRLSLIWQASQRNTLKLQYGESFRTPVNNEMYSSDDVTIGNSQLTSEYVKTSELVWLHLADFGQLEFVYFHNQLHDFINLVPLNNSESQFTFDNVVDETISGFESSFTIDNDKTNYAFTYTHLMNDPINQSFAQFASARISHQIGHIQFGLDFIWRDKVSSKISNEQVFSSGSYALTNLTANFKKGAYSVKLKAENLFDKQYNVFEPRMFNGAVPGKSRQLSISVGFSF